MIRLAGDLALRERLGRNGQQRFTEQFRHENMTAQIRNVYQKVLDRRGTNCGGARGTMR